MSSEVFNEDCMIGMKRYPDKYFDLSVVDPPYGIEINMNMGRGKGKRKRHKEKDWDNTIPKPEYFTELARISKNMIIWGGNYFPLPLTKAWIFWDKEVAEGVDFADGELAWTSYDKTLVKIKCRYSGYNGADSDGRIHPTQKPVELYKKIYQRYLPEGGIVLDTHLGSGSNRIAADKMGNIDFVGFELDEDYFLSQEKRWKNHKAQLVMFKSKI